MKFKLDSIIIFVKDIDSVKEFYLNNFDFEIIEETPSQWVLFNCGSANLGLHAIPTEYLETGLKDDTELTNTKVVFETKNNINELRAQLVSNQVKMREVESWEGYPFSVCDGEDPEGNIFQIKQRRS